MSFTGTPFLFLLLPVTFVLYYNPLIKKRGFRNVLLILVGLAFYGLGDTTYIPLIILSAFLTYLLAVLRYKTQAKIFLVIPILWNAGCLIFFKYVNMVLGSALFAGNDPAMHFAFPLGLSYYTFMAISFSVDIAKSNEKPGFIKSFLYITFFPSVVSGPITQYHAFEGQVWADRESRKKRREGLCRFAMGAVKKIMFADILAFIADRCFDSGVNLSVCTAWLGIIAYMLQLYFDFSGYSDMAIGVAKLFGFDLMENFNYPFSARSISEFWKKWHMSLTKWFTTYVYIPLGGNRVSTGRHILNLLIIWLLTGIWHGAGLNFIIWGLIFFVVQLIEKYTHPEKIPAALGHIYTLVIMLVAFTFFRAASLQAALGYLGDMFGVHAAGLTDSYLFTACRGYWMPLIFGCILSLPVYPRLRQTAFGHTAIVRGVTQVCIWALFVISIMMELGFNFSASLYVGF